MILYLDTSALVKKYFKEKYSSEVIAAWKSSIGIATSAVAYAELLAAVYRKSTETRIGKSDSVIIFLLKFLKWFFLVCRYDFYKRRIWLQRPHRNSGG